MRLIEDATSMTETVRRWRSESQTIGFVPTMGWFHEGHLSLMRESVRKADKTVVSLFVNPRQFGPQEDLESYPKDLDRDAQLAEKTGVDILFSPSSDIIYPDGYQTNISVKNLSLGLCGGSRPGHFDGVTTIVTKLFNLVQPDIAIFGEKDYQQLAVIRQLVKDLNYNITIIGHPIVREHDGLAMSSRNKYLTGDSRKNALCLFRAIKHAQQRVRSSEIPVKSTELIEELLEIIHTTPHCDPDYIEIVDKVTLTATEIAESGNILALAVFVNEKVRLIDNTTL